MRRVGWLAPLIAVAVALGLWELVVRVGLISEHSIPTMSATVGQLFSELGESSFWSAVWHTVEGWALGLGIAMVLGIPIGVLVGSSRWVFRAFRVPIEFLRPIPSVALIPLAVLLFGTDLRSKLLLVVYASFWQVLIQVLSGVQDVDPVAMDTAHSYRLGRWSRVRHVVWPTTLPYAVTGFRLAAAVALVLAVTAELIIGSPGLGKEIAVAQTSGAVPAMYALVVVAGLLGVGVNLAARALERRVLAWHPSTRREATG
jgi:ABC-type nitrate/sulfonate/bicarbonate transport system permease component